MSFSSGDDKSIIYKSPEIVTAYTYLYIKLDIGATRSYFINN
jgi:hypothetical protein